MYGFQYIHLKARGSQVGAPREGPRRAGRRGRRALLVEREGRRRDEDESRGVRDRSRSPERGGGGGGYDDRGGGGAAGEGAGCARRGGGGGGRGARGGAAGVAHMYGLYISSGS